MFKCDILPGTFREEHNAKVIGPLHSDGAWNSFGSAMVFLTWKGQSRVRVWARPYQPRTPDQRAARCCFHGAVQAWHGEDAASQALWNTYAKSISTTYAPLSGFNAYVGAYIRMPCTFPGTPAEYKAYIGCPYPIL